MKKNRKKLVGIVFVSSLLIVPSVNNVSAAEEDNYIVHEVTLIPGSPAIEKLIEPEIPKVEGEIEDPPLLPGEELENVENETEKENEGNVVTEEKPPRLFDAAVGDKVNFDNFSAVITSDKTAIGEISKPIDMETLEIALAKLKQDFNQQFGINVNIEPLSQTELTKGKGTVVTNQGIPFAEINRETNTVTFKSTVNSISVKVNVIGSVNE